MHPQPGLPSDPIVYIHDAHTHRWLRFIHPQEIIRAERMEDVLPALRRVEAGLQIGLCAAGFLGYEAAPAFDSALEVFPLSTSEGHEEGPGARPFPLLWFGLYTAPEPVALPEDTDTACMLGDWQASVNRPQYDAAIAAVKTAIARGDTYQVNYTMRLRAPFSGDPWALFLQLERSQQAQYAAYLDIGDYVICSASPELFFTANDGHISSKPMKGTTARGLTLAEDRALAAWLQADEKNRAENVMIVDMIRNDLGRIAAVGSVRVPRLFDVERYPTVWQMTSTVEAESAEGLTGLLSALFPCASITGAPKVSTMRLIAALETAPRRIYTGAIGFVMSEKREVESGKPTSQTQNFEPRTPNTDRIQFSVAIRTVLVDRQAGLAEYGVGGGVVWDSTAAGEYEECYIKARLLTRPRPRFALLESLLWTPADGCFLLDLHLRRLAGSAEYFGFPLQLDDLRRTLDELVAALPPEAHKVRLLLHRDGRIQTGAQALSTDAKPEPALLRLAAGPVSSADPFLYHKTTYRQAYAIARRGLPANCEAVFFNERGELTESETANLVLQINGRRLTPPVAAGLLQGVMRAHLLAAGEIEEAPLTIDDLPRAEAIYLINSVRKQRIAVLA